MPNAISFNHGYLAEMLEHPMEFATDKGKSALGRLMHLWGFDDDDLSINDSLVGTTLSERITNWNC